MTGIMRDKVKEKELEELVVVLFAKVEIPRPWRRWTRIFMRQQGRLHHQNHTTPSWVSKQNPAPSDGSSPRYRYLNLVRLSRIWADLWLLGPLPTGRAPKAVIASFYVQTNSSWFALVSTFDSWVFTQKVSISICCNSRFNCRRFISSLSESIDFEILLSPGQIK